MTSEWAMRLALGQAAQCADTGDVPVGAVIVPTEALSRSGLPGQEASAVCLARGRNQREMTADPTAHAELLAIRQAGESLGTWRLTGYTLVVTLEPCTMCAGAAVNARLDGIVFGAIDPKAGAVGSLWDVVRDRRLNHRPQVESGVLAEDCGRLLLEFFAARRLR